MSRELWNWRRLPANWKTVCTLHVHSWIQRALADFRCSTKVFEDNWTRSDRQDTTGDCSGFGRTGTCARCASGVCWCAGASGLPSYNYALWRMGMGWASAYVSWLSVLQSRKHNEGHATDMYDEHIRAHQPQMYVWERLAADGVTLANLDESLIRNWRWTYSWNCIVWADRGYSFKMEAA